MFSKYLNRPIDSSNNSRECEDTFEKHILNIASIDSQIYQLYGLDKAVGNYGLNTASFSLIKSTGLLSGTAFDVLAVESLGDNDKIALESIGEKIKEKTAEWSAKILTFIKSSMHKVILLLKPIYEQIKIKTKKIKSGTFDIARATHQKIKTHPYKTIALVLASITAVVGLIVFASTKFPKAGSKNTEIKSFCDTFKHMGESIKSPFCDISISTTNAGKITHSVVPHTVSLIDETPVDLGWTSTAVNKLTNVSDGLMSKLTNEWESFSNKSVITSSHMQSSINSLLGRESFGDDGFNGEPDLLSIMWSVITTIYYIFKAVVVIGLSAIKGVFDVLSHFYSRVSIAHY